MSTATVTAKGQVTIPKHVREALGLREHDKVVFVVEGDHAIMKPLGTVNPRDLRGIFEGRAPYPGWEAEREAARRHVVEHVLGVRFGEEEPTTGNNV